MIAFLAHPTFKFAIDDITGAVRILKEIKQHEEVIYSSTFATDLII